MKRKSIVLIGSLVLLAFGCTFPFGFEDPQPVASWRCQVYRFALVKLDQSGALEWTRPFGYASHVAPILVLENKDGGYVATFTSQSLQSSIAVFDTFGSLQWQKVIGDNNASTHVWSFQQTSEGGFVLAGIKQHLGNADFWILRLDKSGNTQWEKTMGGSQTEHGFSIQQTLDLGFIVAGSASSSDGDVNQVAGLTDYWIVKLTQSGDIEWKKTFGGCGEDIARSIRQTKDGGYIIAGTSIVDACGVSSTRGYDLGILKLDSSGSLRWQKYMGGTNADFASSIGQSTDGGYYVAGFTDSNDGDVTGFNGARDFWVLKLDELGGIQWNKALGSGYSEEAYSIQQTDDDGYVTCGVTSSTNGGFVQQDPEDEDFWIVKLTESGSMEWQKSFGGSCKDKAMSIDITSDGGYIVAGTITE